MQPLASMAVNPNSAAPEGSADENALRGYVRELRQALGEQLADVVLFGSRATGTARSDSDYDVGIFVNRGTHLPDARRLASDLAYPWVVDGIDIRPIIIPIGRRSEPSQLLRHIAEHGKRLA